ncbi:unnamed protein product [Mycena citricolor]|uniref:Uncharacterized protein n=1 Tax=Mycena citricolor TaxID=2018698 RepID=A0AAD2HFQ9_9AGAR|nr:unnamed protein product [Mycena citricolor]
MGVAGREGEMHEISVPCLRGNSIIGSPTRVLMTILTAVAAGWVCRPEGPGRRKPVLTGTLPNERHTRQAGDLGNLRVNLDFTIPEIHSELALLLRRQLLITEDCDVSVRARAESAEIDLHWMGLTR